MWLVELFFKEFMLDGQFGKTKYYAILIEFQERGSPHVHSFIWILNTLSIQMEDAYIDFNGKTVYAQMSYHINVFQVSYDLVNSCSL